MSNASPVQSSSGVVRLLSRQLALIDLTLVAFHNQTVGLTGEGVKLEQLQEVATREAGYVVGGDQTPVNVSLLAFPSDFFTSFRLRCAESLCGEPKALPVSTKSPVVNEGGSSPDGGHDRVIQDLDTGLIVVAHDVMEVEEVESAKNIATPEEGACAVLERSSQLGSQPVQGPSYWEVEGKVLAAGMLSEFDSFREKFTLLTRSGNPSIVQEMLDKLEEFDQTCLVPFRQAVDFPVTEPDV